MDPSYGRDVTAFLTPPDELAPKGVALRDVLSLEQVERDLFKASVVYEDRWSLYGGQVAAQALIAAGRTVADDRVPHSLHGYYLRPGDSRLPVVFRVARDRDGGSFSARRVVAVQGGEVILNLSASFAVPDASAESVVEAALPDVSRPSLATVGTAPPRLIDVEQWLPEQPTETYAWPTRIWLRCTASLPSDPLVQAALLTYLSDLSTGHGGLPQSRGKVQSTIDHVLWLHRPVVADGWVLSELRSVSVGHGRGLYTGGLWLEDGTLAGTLAQETLFRTPRSRGASGAAEVRP